MTLRVGVIAISTLLPFMSCSDMPMTPDASCSCPTPKASDVTYNPSSGLTATNVQGALDQLAVKPAEAPIGPRVYTKVLNLTPTTNVSVGGTLHCDDDLHDLPLAGSCGLTVANANAAMIGSGVALVLPSEGTPLAGFACTYQQATAGGTLAVQIIAICLRNAR